MPTLLQNLCEPVIGMLKTGMTMNAVTVAMIVGCSTCAFRHLRFRLSPLQKHVRKVVGGFEKKSCVSTGVRKPRTTYASPTAMI